MAKLEDLTMGDATQEFKRQRWLAIEAAEEGNEAKAWGHLQKAVALREHVRQLGGRPPF